MHVDSEDIPGTSKAAKYNFYDDCSEGGHPGILKLLGDPNKSEQPSYGGDEYCEDAKKLIQEAINSYAATINFTPGTPWGSKLTSECIQSAIDSIESLVFGNQPTARMVLIANTTEVGDVYTPKELEAVAAICRKLALLLVMDGGRLSAALASKKNDRMTFDDIFRLTDVFWIGGAANGALARRRHRHQG